MTAGSTMIPETAREGVRHTVTPWFAGLVETMSDKQRIQRNDNLDPDTCISMIMYLVNSNYVCQTDTMHQYMTNVIHIV